MVEKIIENPSKKTEDESLNEISNIEKAIDFMTSMSTKARYLEIRALLAELHKIIVDDLTPPPQGEGSRYPGQLRPDQCNDQRVCAYPTGSQVKVPDYFDELMQFVNDQTKTQYHLLAIALAHHRMAWIHPFDNGNGRIIRMFTYALLIKQGFQVMQEWEDLKSDRDLLHGSR